MSNFRQADPGVAPALAGAAAGRLLYVVGPSGAGKDTLLAYAQSRLPPAQQPPVRFARRAITRPASAEGEQHEALTPQQFEAQAAAGHFAMVWRANGHAYGVRREIRDWLDAGETVVVNGSRGYLGQVRQDFPQLQVISVTVDPELLRQRLLARGRDTPEQIAGRLARAVEFALPAGTAALEIRNDGPVETAGGALLRAITGR